MTTNKRVCVYCAASTLCTQKFLDAGTELGQRLARLNITVVYGGSTEGVMGALADGALSMGGAVTGWLPRFLMQHEILHPHLSETHIVETMHMRKHGMMMNSDGIVALPGGIGTLEELLEAITWKRHGLIQIPILIVNIDGFYDPLFHLFKNMFDEQIISSEDVSNPPWTVVHSPQEAIDHLLKEWQQSE